MGYMANHQPLRVDASELEPGTQTVIALAKVYDPGSSMAGGLRIARYAHGDDYHEVLRERLLELGAFVHAEAGVDVAYRPTVDSAPLLEREVAHRAGLGWIGKNAMLIHPKLGSYTFLAELLVDTHLEPSTAKVPDRCGTCSRCIDACPTNAIVGPYVIDARRCISYLTIELRSPIPRELRPLIGDHVFGCDICQDVCPWNAKSTPTMDTAFLPRAAYQSLDPLALLAMDQETFSTTFRKSPIKRTKRRGLLRNAAVVVGNMKDPQHVDFLQARLKQEPEPLVRGHIAWALGQIPNAKSRTVLREQSVAESDPYVAEEIRFALEQQHVALF